MVSRLISDLSRASLSASCFLLWDICITLDQEVEYIWSKPSRSWIKWAFLFARYFSLFTQISHRLIEFRVTYHPSFVLAHKSVLRVWFGIQVLLVFMIMIGAEIVMMARVYAIYNKNKHVGIGFIFLLLAESTTVAVGFGITFPRTDDGIRANDLIKHSSRSFVYFGIVVLISQVIILVLSVVRYITGRWARARIIQLMFRDGTIAFCVLLVVTGSLLFFLFEDLPYSATCSAWMVSFISSIECRLILNLHHSEITSQLGSVSHSLTDRPELTTFLSVGDVPDAGVVSGVGSSYERYFEETERRQSVFNV